MGPMVGSLSSRVHAAGRSGFDARTAAEAVRAFGGSPPVESREVTIQGPEIAEDGAAVSLSLASTLADVRQLLLLVERNPTLLVSRFEVSDGVEPAFALKVKMSETSGVAAVAITQDGRSFIARREVKVTLGGCLGSGGTATTATPASEPSRIRAQARASGALVRVLMTHDMESGQRRDGAGKLVPAWHITDVGATLNGRPVFAAQWGPGVSRNPLLQFQLKGAKAGDRLAITWRDNRGASRTDETSVA
ncbi:thiosulfate oxidation carrier complex protein SoxZ [Azohydromonas aeria]|uniref:thiosulfate oxidation carrier complex protein SoxZ n=1 Tax=Azohydromonas aeria TaxID=2590212 RepID=UPI0028739925|nr:thiosulfate oxidation carrier complex protein SoxZ [Azohydromonas aeria]